MYCRPISRIAAGIILGALAGCGGGGSKQVAGLAGVVTDPEGRPVVGATVTTGSRSATSLTNGTFVLDDVQEGYQLVQASNTVNGQHLSGETVVDVVGNEQNRNTNIMLSNEDTQGRIAGSVIDPNGFSLPGAKVFIKGAYGSTLAVTDNNGNYTARRIPSGFTYDVTASLAGFVNHTLSVHVADGQTAAASFALSNGSSQGPIPAPTGVSAQAWTLADTVSRSATTPSTQGLYDWLKRVYRQKRGLPERTAAKNVERKGATSRLWPVGSVVEVDLFWTFKSYNDLFGYVVKRGAGQATPTTTAVLRDPEAGSFFDVDPLLTPDTTYSYTVHALDTIDFPSSGAIGPGSATVSATPLAPMRAIAPTPDALTGPTPLFQWQAVNRAAGYQIYVWDRFPALFYDPNNTTEPAAVQPIWPQDLNNPGSSFVSGNASVTKTYQGPALQSGHTYYWMVVATDSTSAQSTNALSASELRKFTAQ